MKKIIIIALIVAAVAALVIFRPWKGSAAKSSDAATATAKVERGPIRQSVASTGRVVSNLDVDIKCKASGEVVKLPFDVSDSVKAGDLLVELNPVDELRNVKQAEVALAASQAKLEQAKLNLTVQEETLKTDLRRAESGLRSAEASADDARAKADRLGNLMDKKLASIEESQSAETTAIQAKANLEGARIRMDEMKIAETALGSKRQDVRLAETQVEENEILLSDVQQRLKDTKVNAPMDGVVSARNVQTGTIISSGISNVGGGTTVLTLSDLSHIFVLASIDESDIGGILAGQAAEITADAFPNGKFTGRVVRIATRGVNVSNVVTFEVKIEITSANKSLLKPEMTANVSIIIAEKEDALLAPVEALYRQSGRQTVDVTTAGGATEARPVDVGISDGLKSEIISGLNAGDVVMLRKGEAESKWRATERPHGPF